MMLMNVSEKFIEKHLQNVGEEHGGEPDDELSCFNWVYYLISGPVVAMILEGHEAANKIKLLASKRENVFFWSFGRGGGIHGPLDRIYKTLENDSYYRVFAGKPIDLHACFLKGPMSFLVIKPKAFGKDCVGEILSAVEDNSYIVKAPDLKHIDLSSEVYLVGSNYVYQSKPDEMRSDVDLFFPHGLTIWTDPESQYLFGKMFEPTLIGLDWED
ncbi:hypothetical protein C5167_047152 [Papaver somniferum]|uniref:Nucleoside-diphosphate kinase n=1 Tax=Papaver somniferum TaxID=3469 RepID=A0A4Y7LI14_PAPSO|nr:hypothetical protein C5167_047152 [Papaver somniferum]